MPSDISQPNDDSSESAPGTEPDESEDTVVTHDGQRQIEPGDDGGQEAVEQHREHAEELEDSTDRSPESEDDA